MASCEDIVDKIIQDKRTQQRRRANEDKIDKIIMELDQIRFDIVGGYPSQYLVENGKVYWATVNDNDEPELIHMPIDEFISEYGWAIDPEF
jgi:hypothetical protein